jgi:hypothetical protein
VKAYQRPSLLRHVAYGKPCAVAVAPGRAVDGRKHLLGPDAPDVPQAVLENSLLDGDLGARIEMLQAAAAAHAKMRTARRDPRRALLQHPVERRDLEARLAAPGRAGDQFARQRAFDENGLAVAARNTATFLVEGFDDEILHTIPRRRSSKCASKRGDWKYTRGATFPRRVAPEITKA